MKDSVKITVIATGFREAEMDRPRHHETYDPVILSREVSRESSHQLSYQVARDHFDVPETVAEPEPVFVPEPAFESDPTPVAFQESALANASQAAEAISLDAMRSAAPRYEVEDLDIPAFLRKRIEVM